MKNTETKNLFLDEEGLLNNLSSEGSFSEDRKEAYKRWKETPAPTTRDEYWKYTRVAPLLNKTYNVDFKPASFNEALMRDIEAYNLVFVNGLFVEEKSDRIVEDNLVISDLKWVMENRPALLPSVKEEAAGDYFSLLNSAFFQNGHFIFVGKGQQLEKPVRIAHITTGNERMVNVRGMVKMGENSEARIIETWDQDSANQNLVNSRTDYVLSANARLDVIKLQSMEGSNSLINQDFADQSRDSNLTVSTISMSGKMIRNNTNSDLNGEHSECNLNGLYMLKGSEHVDNHTKVNHAVPHCESNELYKGILNEKSKGVFNGKVIVSRDAQKTNAFQYNGNILLTDDAQIYSKPELEIYADDVKCSHGSTTGQLDQEALFYLQSRGIGKDAARNLLLTAFASEVLDRIKVPELKERIDQYISERYNTDANH